MNLFKWIQWTAFGVIFGALGGALGLVFDYFFAYLFIGSPMPYAPESHLFYLPAGAVTGLFGAFLTAYFGAPLGGTVQARTDLSVASGALVAGWLGIYLLPVGERLYNLSAVLLGKTARSEGLDPVHLTIAFCIALIAFAVLGLLLALRSDHLSAAGILTALTVSAGLALNRNGTGRPLEAQSLVLDALIVGLAFAFAELIRRRNPRATLVIGAVLILPVVLWTETRAMQVPSDQPDAAYSTADGKTPPHLILIVVDTLRADVLQSVVDHTPEGQAFAEHFSDATWFDRTQAAAPWTAPSMASIMTGLYPAEHGFGVLTEERDPNRTLRPLAANVPTLASRLSRRGYLSEAVLANPILFSGSGIDRGFHRYEILDSTTKKLPLLSALAQLDVLDIDAYQNAELVNRRLTRNLRRLKKAQRPVFLWLQYLDPHEPIYRHPELPADPSAEGLDEEQRLYRDEVRYTLKHLDTAIREIQDAGLWDNSVTVFVSDHGEMMIADGHKTPVIGDDGELLRHGHGKALYNGVTRVPLIIRAPDGKTTAKGARRVKALVSHTDLHDTVVDLLGLDIPSIGEDRISLAPYVRGGKPPQRRTWALLGGIQAGIPQRGLVTETHKLIVYDQQRKPVELYNLDRDPGETSNITRFPRFDWSRFNEQLESLWSELRVREDDGEAALDEETRGRLEALGYL